MQMTSETKVGLLTVVALVLFVMTTLFITNISPKGHIVEARFSRIEGLQAGAPVKLAGLDVGRVIKIYFDDQEVIVKMRIYNRNDVKLGKKTGVVITSASVLGDKYLELMIRPHDEPLPKGARLKGESPITMDQFMIIAYESMTSLAEITDALKEIAGDKNFKDNLKNTLQRLDRISNSVEQITYKINKIDFTTINNRTVSLLDNLDQLIRESRGELKTALVALKETMDNARETSIIVKDFAAEFSQNGETSMQMREALALAVQVLKTSNELLALLKNESPEILADVKESAKSLKEATAKLNELIRRVSEYATEDNLQDLETTLSDTAELVEKANEVVSQYSALKFTTSFETSFDPGSAYYYNGLDLTIANDKNRFTRLGISGLGGANELDLQFGASWYSFSGSFGILNNKFGVELSKNFTEYFILGAELYDPAAPQLEVFSSLYFGRSGLYFKYSYYDVLNQDFQRPTFTLGYKF
ncbi:MAG: MlaD family protein [Bacillota bacterium]